MMQILSVLIINKDLTVKCIEVSSMAINNLMNKRKRNINERN